MDIFSLLFIFLDQICQEFLRGTCTKGMKCEFKHTTNFREKAVVCKHWLRGLCKKGDQCEFLHEFNMRKMPECWFYSRYGECSNEDCMYLHIDPESKIKECALVARGFFKHGKLYLIQSLKLFNGFFLFLRLNFS